MAQLSCFSLTSFRPATLSEIVKLLKDTPVSHAYLILATFYSVGTTMPSLQIPMQSGVSPAQLKQARVLPLPTLSSLGPDVAISYRPISNLPSLSKLIDRVVVTGFSEHSTTFSLSPVQQFACRPCHSTETTTVSVYNDLVFFSWTPFCM